MFKNTHMRSRRCYNRFFIHLSEPVFDARAGLCPLVALPEVAFLSGDLSAGGGSTGSVSPACFVLPPSGGCLRMSKTPSCTCWSPWTRSPWTRRTRNSLGCGSSTCPSWGTPDTVCVCFCVRVMFKHILQVFTWLCGVSVFIGGLFQPPLPLIHVADRLSASAKSFICPIVILLTPYINTEPFLSVRCLSCSPTVLIFLRLVCTDWL